MIDGIEVLKAFQPHRDGAIVAHSGTAGRHWSDVSTDPNRDLRLESSMGQTTSAAFGLALGLPDEKVVIFDSEGALLMNLGVLASIAGKAPKNFYHFLLDNECYATTGGQPVPNAQGIDYAGMAKSAGYKSTHHFDDLEELVTSIEDIMQEEGPVFISVKIEAEVQNLPMALRERSTGRARLETIRDFQEHMGIPAP
jgi:thiamine pyrophosphate-dependent acetolactate synthase large subunit-like protein